MGYDELDDDILDLLGDIGCARPAPAPRRMTITEFPDLDARSMTTRSITLAELQAHGDAIVATGKARLSLISGSRFGDARSAGACLRHDANVLAVSALIGDYDNTPGVERGIAAEEAVRRIRAAGFAAWVHTTPSNEQEDKGSRWRAIVPLSRDVTPDEHAGLMARLNGALLHPLATLDPAERARHQAAHPGVPLPPPHALARESFNLSQSFYLGRVGGVAYESVLIEGRPFDLIAGAFPEAWEPPTLGGGKRRGDDGREAPDDLMLEAKRSADEASIRADLETGRLASALRHAAGLGRQEYHDPEWQRPIMALAFSTPDNLATEVWALILAEFVEPSVRMVRWAADGKAGDVRRQAVRIWNKARLRDVADPTTLAGLYGLARDGGWSWTAAEAVARTLAPTTGASGQSAGPDDPETIVPLTALQALADTEAGDPFSDLGLARAFLDATDKPVRYCASLGWGRWDGRRWDFCEESGGAVLAAIGGFNARIGREVVDRALRIGKLILAGKLPPEAAAMFGADDERTPLDDALAEAEAPGRAGRPASPAKAASDLLRRAKTMQRALESAARRKAVAEIVATLPGVAVAIEALDHDKYLLGTPGGTVNLRTGKMREARPDDLITRLTTVAPAPEGAPAPRWERFLGEVFPGEPEMIPFMQRLLGYATTGDTKEEVFAYLRAGGRNGKGTCMGSAAGVLGDYGAVMDPATLVATVAPQHSAPLAVLRGARLVRAPELPAGGTLDEARLKNLTGGDRITARLMRENPMTFDFAGTLFLEANSLLRLKTVDHAMRARMLLIEFRQTFHDPEKGPVPEGGAIMDKGLKAALAEEAPAILRWLIDGALAWQKDGLKPPQRILDDSAAYLDGEDVFGLFMAAEVEADPRAWVASADLAMWFAAWAERERVVPWTGRAIAQKLKELGFRPALAGANRARGFKGLRRRTLPTDERADNPFDEHPGDDLADLL